MEEDVRQPRRLVYGPALYAGYEGIVVDAAAAAKLGALARATTLQEFVAVMYDGVWEQYVEVGVEDGDEVPSPNDPFDYDEWFSDGSINEYPADTAWDAASAVVAQLVAEDPVGLRGIRSGGGSPGGNMDAISGPLDQLALLASRIDPVADGIIVERDDGLTDQGMSKVLYE